MESKNDLGIPLLHSESFSSSSRDVRLAVSETPRTEKLDGDDADDAEKTFEEFVRENTFPQFKDYYVDHKRLAKYNAAVKSRRLGAEKQFVECLEFEWIKYTSFLRKTIASLDAAAPTKSLRADVLRANRFAALNRTILREAIVAHDQISTRAPLFPAWRFKINEPWHEPLIKILHKISAVYDRERSELSGVGIDQENFVRESIKFFVRPDRIVDVIAEVIPHLPIYTFAKSDQALCPIDSVYLDDTMHTSYQHRLLKRENNKLVRLRWYGKDRRKVFCERKVHHESWSGRDSSKKRFELRGRDVLPFLRGQKVPDRPIAHQIHDIVRSKQLHPSVRTSYKRLAFQKQGSNAIRLSLDTNLTMIRETTSHLEWFTPENELSDEDVHYFPFAILEIKLQGTFVTQPPIWIQHLMESSTLNKMFAFSKFCHATFALYPGLRVPYWIEQYADDFPLLSARQKGGNTQPASIFGSTQTKSKTIVEKVRVDPKAFWSIEKLFIKWLEMALVILVVGIALLKVAPTMGHTMIACGAFVTLYALARYYHRLNGLYHRKVITYHDSFGPAVLAGFILLAIVLSETHGVDIARNLT